MALAMEAREGFRSLWSLCLSCNRGFGFSTPCLRVLYPSATFHRHPHRNAHSQVHQHTPRSRGVGTPGVIWHRKVPPSGLALRERQHLAMAGSRHLHSPRNATAHCVARANHHFPHGCCIRYALGVMDVCGCSSGSACRGVWALLSRTAYSGYCSLVRPDTVNRVS